MKKIWVYGMAFMSVALNNVCAEEITAQSKITSVTVYSSNAFITRVAAVELKPGDTKVIVPNIVSDFDPNSLRVRGKGTAEVKILGAQVKTEFLEETPVEKVRELETQIQAIEDQDQKFENERLVLADEKAYLDSIRLFANQKLPEDLVTKMPSAQDLEATLLFLDAKLKENFSRGMDINIQIRENAKKIEALRRELNTISGGGRKNKYSVVVDVEVAKPGSLDMEVSYMVGGASWEPVYDARAQFDKSEVELITNAIVRQNSGEAWEDVAMTLSTAQLTGGGTMPEANSWFIQPFQPPVPMMAPRQLYAAKSKMEAAVMSDETAGAAMQATAPMREMKEASNLYTQAASKGVSVVYNLTRRVTVKSDGTDNKLPVTSQILAANFEYSANPRMIPVAYLRSRVTNAKDLHLLGGRVNVFFEGDFVGSSYIQNIAPGEEFDLYLGADEGVKVKRELLEKKSDDVLIGNIPSPNKKITYKYKLTAENYKAQASRISLFDALPVSQDERIKIKIGQVSQEPKEKDWKDRKGVWRWEFQLEPRAKAEVSYTVTVEFPRDMQVEGLE